MYAITYRICFQKRISLWLYYSAMREHLYNAISISLLLLIRTNIHIIVFNIRINTFALICINLLAYSMITCYVSKIKFENARYSKFSYSTLFYIIHKNNILTANVITLFYMYFKCIAQFSIIIYMAFIKWFCYNF